MGELEVRGPWVASTYADGPTTGADGWFATGDMVTVDPRGFVEIQDRAIRIVATWGMTELCMGLISELHGDQRAVRRGGRAHSEVIAGAAAVPPRRRSPAARTGRLDKRRPAMYHDARRAFYAACVPYLHT